MPVVRLLARTALGALLALGPLAAGAAQPVAEDLDVMVLEPYATTSGADAEVYALFVNVEATDRLAGADSAACERVELVSGDGTTVPFGEFGFTDDVETRLSPGYYHLKLVGLKKPLAAGEHVLVTMHFAEGGSLPIEALVR